MITLEQLLSPASGPVSPLTSWLISSRPNFEPYGISPVVLTFRQTEQEAAYQELILRTTVTHIRFAMFMACGLIVTFGFLDPLVYENGEALQYATLVRFLVLLPSPLLVILATRSSQYPAMAQWIGVAAIAMVGLGWSLLTYRSNVTTVVYTFPAIVMAIAFSFFLSGLFFRYAFAVGLSVTASYALTILTIDLPAGMTVSVGASMFSIFLLFALAAYQKELNSRQLFVSEARERHALARQHQNDSRYIAWLRQLAEFLRHEVRQPVARINSSVEIVGLQSNGNPQIKPHLESAALDAQHIWNLVERASRATDAEAFVRHGNPQRIDLSRLVKESIDAYRQTNSGTNFLLQAADGFWVDADATLLKEAIGNLLGNAASFARPETTVKLVLEDVGGHARIMVSNEGPLVEGDVEALFGAFASTRSGPTSEHQGLGLFLVRLIAEHHGGAANIANLADGSGVAAFISLPRTSRPSLTLSRR